MLTYLTLQNASKQHLQTKSLTFKHTVGRV